jgi:hypothetical protein
MEMVEISKRQLESYKRAEKVCREMRFQESDNRNLTRENYTILIEYFLEWFRGCKKIKYLRPSKKGNFNAMPKL